MYILVHKCSVLYCLVYCCFGRYVEENVSATIYVAATMSYTMSCHCNTAGVETMNINEVPVCK